MLNVEKWSQGRPFFIAFLAPQMVAAAQDMHTAYKGVRERCFGDHQFPLPHFPTWSQMYRSHHKVEGFIRILFSQFAPFGKEGLNLWDSFKFHQQLLKKGETPLNVSPSPDEIEQAKSSLNNLLSGSFNDLKSDFENISPTKNEKESFWNLYDSMELEVSFYFLVTAPCWLLYRLAPAHLYRSARLGDFKAIDRLLRLDPLMIHDPLIGKRIQEFRLNRKFTKYEELMQAPLRRPKEKITRKRVKYSFAGFISAISILINQPLKEPEIRELFDAVIQDAGKGSIDTDLPDSPESFYMAIKRDRDFWMQSLRPLQKKVI